MLLVLSRIVDYKADISARQDLGVLRHILNKLHIPFDSVLCQVSREIDCELLFLTLVVHRLSRYNSIWRILMLAQETVRLLFEQALH